MTWLRSVSACTGSSPAAVMRSRRANVGAAAYGSTRAPITSNETGLVTAPLASTTVPWAISPASPHQILTVHSLVFASYVASWLRPECG